MTFTLAYFRDKSIILTRLTPPPDWYGYFPLSDPIPRIFVHFGEELDNAFWDGKNVILGDGNPEETFSYAVLDTIAHELAHGITERSSALLFE